MAGFDYRQEELETDAMIDALDNIDPTPTDYDTRPACAVPYVVVAALLALCGVGVLCDSLLFVGVVVRMIAHG